VTRRQRRQASKTARPSPRDLRILKEIAEALNGATEVDQALTTTLQRVADLLGLHTGWIWLTDPHTGRYYSAAAQAMPPFLREPVRMTGHTCWCLDAFRRGELTAGNIDVMECSRLRAAGVAGARARTRGLRYHASVPLYFGERPLGIMNVAAPAWRKLTRRELDLLSTIASQVGVAIERGRLAGEGVRVARMEERTNLARDIHDTLVQRLTAIGLHIEAALDALPPAPQLSAVQLQQALALARASVEEARGSMRTLRAPAREQPLPERLAALARAFTTDTGIRVRVRTDERFALSAMEEEELSRVASEALTNVRRHARATGVELSLRVNRGHLRLEIADDGAGFNPRARSSGFGIVGMRERAKALGGTLRIVTASSPRGGTRVIVRMPIARED
jgi:two-component system, NarL family, sensor kinase